MAGCSDQISYPYGPNDTTKNAPDDDSEPEDQRGDETEETACATIEDSVDLPGDEEHIVDVTADCLTIEEDLRINGQSPAFDRLERLDRLVVGGATLVRGVEGQTDLKMLSALERTGGALRVVDNPHIESTTELQSLRIVGDDLEISGNQKLVTVGTFPELRQVHQDIIIADNPALTEITGFNDTAFIAEYDSIQARPRPAGESNEPVTRRRSGPIDPHLIIRDNPVLTSITGFAELTDIDGDLRLINNPKLTTIRGFDSLEFLTGRMVLRHVPKVDSFEDIIRTSCISELVIQGTRLTDLSAFESVYEIGRLEISNNPDLTSLRGLSDDLLVQGPVVIDSNPALSSLSGLWGVDRLGAVQSFERNMPTEYEESANHECVAPIPSSTTSNEEDPQRGDLRITNNDGLVDLGAIPISRIDGDLQIIGNDGLDVIDSFRNLERVSGDLVISHNGGLDTVDGLGQLETVDRLEIIDNPVHDLDALAGIEETRGDVIIAENHQLTKLNDLGALRTVRGTLAIEQNESLAEIAGMTSLYRVTDGLVIQDNPSLPSCQVDDLAGRVSARFTTIESNGAPCQ
jgi:hypothetical protein